MEKQIKVQTEQQLSSIIEKIVKESMRSTLYQNAIIEKEKQEALKEEDDDTKTTDASSTKKETNPSKTIDDEKEKMKNAEVTSADVIDRLNAIRSGRSFKDDEISSKLEEYVNSLNKAERVALLAFLKGISQVVTGEIPASSAVAPDSNPANIEMKKSGEKSKVSIKPVIVKQPEKKQGEQKKSSTEDTSGPVPIKPKR